MTAILIPQLRSGPALRAGWLRRITLAALSAGALLPAAAGAATVPVKHRAAHRAYHRYHHRYRRGHRVYARRRVARRPPVTHAARPHPKPAAPAAAAGPAVISTGQLVDLKGFLQPETVTLFVFTNP